MCLDIRERHVLLPSIQQNLVPKQETEIVMVVLASAETQPIKSGLRSKYEEPFQDQLYGVAAALVVVQL